MIQGPLDVISRLKIIVPESVFPRLMLLRAGVLSGLVWPHPVLSVTLQSLLQAPVGAFQPMRDPCNLCMCLAPTEARLVLRPRLYVSVPQG